MENYITVFGKSTAEYNEKNSKFIAECFHCESEEEASKIIAEQKSKYWDARHNVYAYLLNNGTARFSDDGEPHGTAGMPILEVIKNSELTDVLIVVTRYFGGTLLGTGGLVRAYTKSSRDALLQSEPHAMCPCTRYSIVCDYTFHSNLLNLIRSYAATDINNDFTDKVEVTFCLKDQYVDDFLNKLRETFSGRLTATEKEKLLYSFRLNRGVLNFFSNN